jgi:transposase-like protein
MSRGTRYSPELRDRAVRMVFEHAHDYPSQWAAIKSIAEKLGCRVESLRRWVRQAERDTGKRPGLTTDERAELKRLQREKVELKRANAILRKASAFFAPGGARPPREVMVAFITPDEARVRDRSRSRAAWGSKRP